MSGFLDKSGLKLVLAAVKNKIKFETDNIVQKTQRVTYEVSSQADIDAISRYITIPISIKLTAEFAYSISGFVGVITSGSDGITLNLNGFSASQTTNNIKNNTCRIVITGSGTTTYNIREIVRSKNISFSAGAFAVYNAVNSFCHVIGSAKLTGTINISEDACYLITTDCSAANFYLDAGSTLVIGKYATVGTITNSYGSVIDNRVGNASDTFLRNGVSTFGKYVGIMNGDGTIGSTLNKYVINLTGLSTGAGSAIKLDIEDTFFGLQRNTVASVILGVNRAGSFLLASERSVLTQVLGSCAIRAAIENSNQLAVYVLLSGGGNSQDNVRIKVYEKAYPSTMALAITSLVNGVAIGDTNAGYIAATRIAERSNEVYSTDETNTGKTWIDGSAIYRRVFSATSSASTADKAIVTFSQTVNIINAYGTLTNNAGDVVNLNVFVQYYNPSSKTYNLRTPAATDQSSKVTIVLEYTKG